MKLKSLLKESQQLDYRRMNVGEEEEKGMTNEEKRAFLEAVASYRQLGEMISHKGNLGEIHENIKKIVENAGSLTIKETGDWFDRVTVQRHMKSMNESFKVFSNTIKEVGMLQQRMESAYDEIGEVLGKYYEIKEGNEFGAARAKAIAAGEDEFEVDGKKYKVTSVDADDKENAKKFTNEDEVRTTEDGKEYNVSDAELDGEEKQEKMEDESAEFAKEEPTFDTNESMKLTSLVQERITMSQALKAVRTGETSSVEGIKMSRTLANAIASWVMSSTYGQKYGKTMMKSPMAASWKIILSDMWGVEKFVSRTDKANLGKVKAELAAIKTKLGL
jgi:uncharacterized protein (UPF0128 family)